DTSDAPFSIAVAALALTSPRGGEHYVCGTTQKVTWTSVGVQGTVSVFLSRNGGGRWETLASGAANTGALSWQGTAPVTTSARVKICADGNANCADSSKSNFSIDSPPAPPAATLTVVSPNGGESWKIGTTHSITWSSTGLSGGSVKIELSTNGGTSW